jgi:hypothetical protein
MGDGSWKCFGDIGLEHDDVRSLVSAPSILAAYHLAEIGALVFGSQFLR